MIRVIKPGLQTTIQDQGRFGYYEVGMAPSGAFDSFSFIVANILVGNDLNAAAFETVYTGPSLIFEKDGSIAITGAVIPPKINGKDVPMWEAINIKKGDVLTFDTLKSGARGYIAVSGGIDVPVVTGSRSTFLPLRIGGLNGRPLREGDILKIGDLRKYETRAGARIDEKYIPKFSNFSEVHIIDGLCSYRITKGSKEILVEEDWVITPDANRVGYRIRGSKPLEWIERVQPFGAGGEPSNVVDVGYPIGSIQAPDVNEPIILFKDAVTCGGYATIATIISADLDKMAQKKTGDKIKFRYVTIDEALSFRRANNANLKEIGSHIKKYYTK